MLRGMSSDNRNGPKVTIKADCFGCAHAESERYTCQGDSGIDVYCAHPEAISSAPSSKAQRRRIGDTTWDTPDWCPLLSACLSEMVADLARVSP